MYACVRSSYILNLLPLYPDFHSTLTSSAQEAVPPPQDDSEEDRQLLKGYSCTLDVRPPPLSLDDLEVWEESEKKRSKQLSVMSPLRGLKDARCG